MSLRKGSWMPQGRIIYRSFVTENGKIPKHPFQNLINYTKMATILFGSKDHTEILSAHPWEGLNNRQIFNIQSPFWNKDSVKLKCYLNCPGSTLRQLPVWRPRQRITNFECYHRRRGSAVLKFPTTQAVSLMNTNTPDTWWGADPCLLPWLAPTIRRTELSIAPR